LEIVLSPPARVEIAEIWSSIAIHDPPAADRMVAGIVRGLRRLALFPHSGRPRNDLAAGLRSYFIRPRHTVFYRIRGEHLEVVHVLHHARDVSRFFPDR